MIIYARSRHVVILLYSAILLSCKMVTKTSAERNFIRMSFTDRCQIWLLMLSKFKRSNQLLLPLKSSENQRYFKGYKS